jgi:transposase
VKEKRYSENFKKRMIQRMVGPNGVSARALSKEVGVCQPTLSLWLRNASRVTTVKDEKTEPVARRPEDWTASEKLQAVLEAEGKADAELGLWLRRKGLKAQHLREWRTTLVERAQAVFAPRETRPNPESRKRVKELERELKRKDKALAETAALLVLQGKMEALWAAEDDATRPSSDESSSRTSRRRKPQGRV